MIEVTMDTKLEFLGTTISNPWKTYASKKGLFFLKKNLKWDYSS